MAWQVDGFTNEYPTSFQKCMAAIFFQTFEIQTSFHMVVNFWQPFCFKHLKPRTNTKWLQQSDCQMVQLVQLLNGSGIGMSPYFKWLKQDGYRMDHSLQLVQLSNGSGIWIFHILQCFDICLKVIPQKAYSII